MSQRYVIRMFESTEKDGQTCAGTLVEPVNRHLAKYGYSADDVEGSVRRDVAKGKLPSGKVYQICPSMGNVELIRSVAASMDGTFERVFLDPASGLYGELRRIRLPKDFRCPEPEPSMSCSLAAFRAS